MGRENGSDAEPRIGGGRRKGRRGGREGKEGAEKLGVEGDGVGGVEGGCFEVGRGALDDGEDAREGRGVEDVEESGFEHLVKENEGEGVSGRKEKGRGRACEGETYPAEEEGRRGEE